MRNASKSWRNASQRWKVVSADMENLTTDKLILALGVILVLLGAYNTFYTLQSARGVWKTLHHPPEKNPRKFMQTYCIFIHLAV